MVAYAFVSAVLLEASVVAAFPSLAGNVHLLDKRIGAVAPFPDYPGSPAHALYNKFDASKQLVSTSGDHAYMPPGPDDIRGPCAGLNAAANHGYLPRSGIADAESINTGLFEAFGLAEDATLFLQAATMFFDGDPVSGRWSIGHHSDKTQSLGAAGNALGNETGICAYGHLKTEGDASITRGDWLAPDMNSNCASYPEFAQQLIDLGNSMGGGLLTAPVMAEHQYQRKLHSIQTNPAYFAPPYAGVAFTFGAHMFAFELLGNHSAEMPRGFLTPEVFESFFSYTRDSSGALQFTFGHERIPDNWYKRADDDQWTLNDILISTGQQCASYPTNCQVGGNTGTPNSFTGIDLGNLTGGFINDATDLQDPAKVGCFISQNIQAEAPSFLDNVFEGGALELAKSKIATTLVPALAGLGSCPGLPAGRSVFDPESEFPSQFPGARLMSKGPRNPY